MILLRQDTLHTGLLLIWYPDPKLIVVNDQPMHFRKSSFFAFLLLLYLVLRHVLLRFPRMLSWALEYQFTETTSDNNTFDIKLVPYKALEDIPVHSKDFFFVAINDGLISIVDGDHMIDFLPHSICTTYNQDVRTIGLSRYPRVGSKSTKRTTAEGVQFTVCFHSFAYCTESIAWDGPTRER